MESVVSWEEPSVDAARKVNAESEAFDEAAGDKVCCRFQSVVNTSGGDTCLKSSVIPLIQLIGLERISPHWPKSSSCNRSSCKVT